MTAPAPDADRVCIVGAGPGGLVLGYLLARAGVPVTILEAHADFDRAFRGDTVHSTTMELMADLGLVAQVEALLHSRLDHLTLVTSTQRLVVAEFGKLRTPFPYVGLLPQAEFLAWLAAEGRQLGAMFDLRMQATARSLVTTDGVVTGVTYDGPGGRHDVHAALVVGADGRGSRIRTLAGIELSKTAPPMDVLWFELPAGPGDELLDPLAIRFGTGRLVVCIQRGSYWQIGYVILKGTVRELHDRGIGALRDDLRAIVPPFGHRTAALTDWKQTQVLAVQTGRVARWHRPGLLLIGDAAHVMSPIGGVGINYAIQDAIAAANLLLEPLRTGTLTEAHLAGVQRRREWPTKVMQGIQAVVQRRVIEQALRGDTPFVIPWFLRAIRAVPFVRQIPSVLFGRGLRVERLRTPWPRAADSVAPPRALGR
ncbi:MAG: FAD-dependent oxidoreductase [Planctomycetes bacterium]|nr:FAD-dependent oxidoreductase [Planctomycetota bacterium]